MSPNRLLLCLVSCCAWIGAVAAGCTNGATPSCGPGAGCGADFDGPPPDSFFSETTMPESSTDASMDAPPDVTAKDAKPRKDVAPEVGPDVTPDSPSDGGGKS